MHINSGNRTHSDLQMFIRQNGRSSAHVSSILAALSLGRQYLSVSPRPERFFQLIARAQYWFGPSIRECQVAKATPRIKQRSIVIIFSFPFLRYSDVLCCLRNIVISSLRLPVRIPFKRGSVLENICDCDVKYFRKPSEGALKIFAGTNRYCELSKPVVSLSTLTCIKYIRISNIFLAWKKFAGTGGWHF